MTTAAHPQAATIADLRRSAQWIPAEVSAAFAQTKANVEGLGIHGRQLDALRIFMNGLAARITAGLDAWESAAVTSQAEARREVLADMVGRGELWQIFRTALALRRDPVLRDVLDVGDLVAANAYNHLQQKATDWNKLPGLRAPPLVVLRAASGPAAASLGDEFLLLDTAGFSLRRFRNQLLPIPIVLLPVDHCGSVWRFVSLFHEVGHLFDADVELSEELVNRSALPDAPSWATATLRSWMKEICADAIGIGLGGEAFVRSLTLDLLASSTDAGTEHPPSSKRVVLLRQLARALGIQRSPPADDVDAAMPDAEAIAQFVVQTKLDALGGHAIADLQRPWAHEKPAIDELSTYLAHPDARNPAMPLDAARNGIRFDHLPIAAEYARTKGVALERIHEDALHVANRRLPRPQSLDYGGGLQNPAAYWRHLTQEVRFDGRRKVRGHR